MNKPGYERKCRICTKPIIRSCYKLRGRFVSKRRLIELGVNIDDVKRNSSKNAIVHQSCYFKLCKEKELMYK